MADNRIGGVYRGKTYGNGVAPAPEIGPEGAGLFGAIKKGYNALANIGSGSKPAAAATIPKDKGDNTRMTLENKVSSKTGSKANGNTPRSSQKMKAKAKSKPKELPAAQMQAEARARRAASAKMAGQDTAPTKKTPSMKTPRASTGRQNQPVVKQAAPKKSTMVYDKGLGRMVDRGVSGLKRAPNR